MRVLAVGDAAFTAAMPEQALYQWGYDVASVGNIDDALDSVIGGSVQIVIADCTMSEGGGLALCRKIRALNLPFHVYIILAVSLDDAQYAALLREAGADDCIPKPARLDELQVRIRIGERVLHLEKTLCETTLRLSTLREQLLAAQKVINSDLRMAGEIQRGLLPSNSSSMQGIAIDWLFRPSTHVSGDVFNFFRLDEQHIGFYIIDVAGHGIAAAMQSFYFTMVYGVIDTHSQLIDLCQAGHPHPIYLPQGSPPLFVGENCLPVGILTLAQYRSSLLNYQTGDRLFFYSDGIIDCASPDEELFGSTRLLEFIDATRQLSVGEVLRQLDEQLRLWHGNDEFDDDVSMLVLEMVAPVAQVLVTNST